MEKTDFKKTLDSYQARHHEFRIIDVPPMQYLMIDGHGDPNSAPEFAAAIEALYPVAYALKFASRKQLDRDYVVPPLEGLWWSPEMSTFTSARDKSRWNWTLMTMVPHWVGREMFDAAAALKADPMAVNPVRLESLEERRCVQTLHIGSFDDETEILAKLHDEFIPNADLTMVGKHHEIYFSDFRKVEPSKLRTILRQPVERR